jgi:transcription elongation factor GreA
MSAINYVTKETLEQMKEELAYLKTKGRAAIASAIAEAREKGDLRENAEYDAAKEAQGHHEAKMSVLENAIALSRVIDVKDLDLSKVSVLSTVTITNTANQKQLKYTLVSPNEADLKLGKISVTSPIGSGLLGKKIGETADIIAPNGKMTFKVEKIEMI